MAFLKQKTSHNHIMGNVYSTFQKYARRGDYDKIIKNNLRFTHLYIIICIFF